MTCPCRVEHGNVERLARINFAPAAVRNQSMVTGRPATPSCAHLSPACTAVEHKLRIGAVRRQPLVAGCCARKKQPSSSTIAVNALATNVIRFKPSARGPKLIL
jgi:hypothetical protein